MMVITEFRDKLNKLENHTYMAEEEVHLTNGVYEAELYHDNIDVLSLSVHTGPKMTGDIINAYTLSTPSLMPWKRIIRVYADVPVLYITYETQGDTVEADDINHVQKAIICTQEALNEETVRATERDKELDAALQLEVSRAVKRENALDEEISAEVVRAKTAEGSNADAISAEISRASDAETSLQDGIDRHTEYVDSEIIALRQADTVLEEQKADKTDVNRELANRYTKDQTYSRQEVLDKIEELIGSAPETLDTFKELADALGNDPNFAATIMTLLAGKVEKESGKVLSSNDYTDSDKLTLTDVDSKKHTHNNKSVLDKVTQMLIDNWTDAYSKRHEHSNKSALDGITTSLITAWNNAVTHISDTVKHITAAERTAWNDAASKKHTHSNKPVLDGITSALVAAWNSAKTHADSPHAPSNAEKNLIVGIRKNGADLSVDSSTRKVNIAVPVKVSELTNDAGYKTTDNNTTYSLGVSAKSATNGNTKIRLTGSDSTTKDILIKGTGATSVTTDPDGNVIITSTDTNTTYGIATPASNGLMAASDKAKLDGVESGAQVNTVIGIKGNAETSYRTGQVNLTPAGIGAAARVHNHTRSQISDMPTKLSEFSNDSGYITADDVDTSQDHSHANKSILDSITQALINTWGTVSNKVDKVSGKGLSTNDFTAAHLGKLNGISAGANNYSLPAATSNVLGGVKTGPNITNSSGTISLTKSNVVSALGYTPGTSSADPITVDSELSATSVNPVENKAVYAALEDKSHFTSAPANGQVVVADGTAGAIKTSGYTIAASVPSGAKFTDTVYTHPATAGNKHIPGGGSSGQILRWSSAGTAAWGADNNSDTKNTAGSTNTSSKLFLVGATSQAANPQTYSHDTAYVGEDGCLYSNNKKVSVDGHTHPYAGSGSAGGAATKAIQDSDGKQINKTYVKKGCTWGDLKGG